MEGKAMGGTPMLRWSDDLLDLEGGDGAGVEVDALLEGAGEVGFVEGDYPALFDDEVFYYSAVGEGGSQDGGVFALGDAFFEEVSSPFFGEDFGEAIARGVFGVHY